MIKYIIINGYPESGKTTFELMCLEKLQGKSCQLSSIDVIKQATAILGWDGEKTPEARRFLSTLKQLSAQYFDTPWRYIEEQLRREYPEKFDSPDIFYVFVDVREPEEIQRYKDERNALTVFINRQVVANNEFSNQSDEHVEDISYDYYVDNNGTLQNLKNEANLFILYLETGLSGEAADELVK